MLFVPRSSSALRWALVLCAIATASGTLPRTVRAQERVDSIVESAHNGLQLGDKMIRVLLGRTDAPQNVERDGLGTVRWNGRRYRGTIDIVPDGRGYAVINRLDLEEYLRGVLPGELGSRDPRDRAALQAQAVAARSYAAARMGERRPVYDVTATVSDQVYPGMSAELPQTDDAVRATRGLVLTWSDRIITAPYHAHGGPMTAGAEEVYWKRGGEPFLRPVDDRAPSGGCYCDAGGSRGWERTFTADELTRLLGAYGRDAGISSSGEVNGLRITTKGASGRVIALEVETTAGRSLLRGNDIRFVLRTNGAILPSTVFTLEQQGSVFTLRGVGNGHGLGMSQWGAIGRARAGQDARAILAAYYPGTRLAPLL
jgi:stage II sporulation protein D